MRSFRTSIRASRTERLSRRGPWRAASAASAAGAAGAAARKRPAGVRGGTRRARCGALARSFSRRCASRAKAADDRPHAAASSGGEVEMLLEIPGAERFPGRCGGRRNCPRIRRSGKSECGCRPWHCFRTGQATASHNRFRDALVGAVGADAAPPPAGRRFRAPPRYNRCGLPRCWDCSWPRSGGYPGGGVWDWSAICRRPGTRSPASSPRSYWRRRRAADHGRQFDLSPHADGGPDVVVNNELFARKSQPVVEPSKVAEIGVARSVVFMPSASAKAS